MLHGSEMGTFWCLFAVSSSCGVAEWLAHWTCNWRITSHAWVTNSSGAIRYFLEQGTLSPLLSTGWSQIQEWFCKLQTCLHWKFVQTSFFIIILFTRYHYIIPLNKWTKRWSHKPEKKFITFSILSNIEKLCFKKFLVQEA